MSSTSLRQAPDWDERVRFDIAESAGFALTDWFHSPRLRRADDERVALAMAGTLLVAALWGKLEAAGFAAGALRAFWTEASPSVGPVGRGAAESAIASLIFELARPAQSRLGADLPR